MTGDRPILIVEDDRDIRETMVDILVDEGYEVVAARHGAEALDCLRGAALLPCLIVLDLMMPVMDGKTFRQHQRLDPRLAEIPVLILSADRAVSEHGRELGAVAALAKPIRPDQLLAAISRYRTSC